MSDRDGLELLAIQLLSNASQLRSAANGSAEMSDLGTIGLQAMSSTQCRYDKTVPLVIQRLLCFELWGEIFTLHPCSEELGSSEHH